MSVKSVWAVARFDSKKHAEIVCSTVPHLANSPTIVEVFEDPQTIGSKDVLTLAAPRLFGLGAQAQH